MAEQTNLQIQETEKQEVEQSAAERTRTGYIFVPRTDIYETDEAIHVVCDMPGVRPDGADITLEQNMLSVSGHVEPTWPEGYSLNYAEYRIGDYERRFTLNTEVNEEAIEAKLNNGVLHITLPKMRPTRHKIAIQAAG